MDRLRKLLASIQTNLKGLGPTQKLLIGSLAVILVMTLFLVSQYAGKSVYVEVWPGANAEDQTRAVTKLQGAGIRAVNQGGKAVVPVAQQQQAFALLAQDGQQPVNSDVVFANLLKNQSWVNSKEQNRQLYKVMLDNWLSGVLSKFKDVESAKVFVDAPEPSGFGTSVRPPKASVTIFTKGGKGIDSSEIEAAAKTVAGSVAGLEVERVSISVDGKARRVARDDDLTAAANQQSARAIEKQFEDKLSNLLSYIDGVVVAVTAQVDTSRSRGVVTKTLPIGEGSVNAPKKESVTTTNESQASPGGVPGVRANTGADTASASGGGAKTTQSTEETEYAASFGTERVEKETAGGAPTRLVATIAVPRGFVIGLLEKEQAPAANGAAPATAPAAADIQKRFDAEKAVIEAALKPHFKTRGSDGADVQGDVVVMMVSGDAVASGGGGGGRSGSGGGGALGTMWAMGGGMIDKVVLGALALVAVAMMALMVRKTGKRIAMPTPEELVGLPPTLEAKSDVVGEADESETALAGIEVGEDEIKSTKMRESVSQFIKQSPDTASKLLNRWISVEE